MTTNELWTLIVEYGIATNSEIDLVTDINGNSIETLNNIIYARTGYKESEFDDDDEPYDIDSDMGFDPYMGSFSFDC